MALRDCRAVDNLLIILKNQLVYLSLIALYYSQFF